MLPAVERIGNVAAVPLCGRSLPSCSGRIWTGTSPRSGRRSAPCRSPTWRLLQPAPAAV